jgi:hypothetical protein
MIISINIEDRRLLEQLLNDLGKEALLEMVEELDSKRRELTDDTQEASTEVDEPAPDKYEDADTLSGCDMQEKSQISTEEKSFNGECRYNPDTPCYAPDSSSSAPAPENCILCPRHSPGNEV